MKTAEIVSSRPEETIVHSPHELNAQKKWDTEDFLYKQTHGYLLLRLFTMRSLSIWFTFFGNKEFFLTDPK
ncbi:hypothetical protein SKAU_G00070970 [Synaphobranchus kaupii]|uniref:Uncharacterized protein n=1 Tax=Synaphobranchus kaupii TaxID=118154 RepID=A0A9Q1JBQ8_SYNKA|nr:hypothetical protein SKAU_G00070970 [Synaphobranchus kaupii]